MADADPATTQPTAASRDAVGPWSDLALHTIGWKAFQDLCSQVFEVALGRPVEIFREAQDGGQDGVFLIPAVGGEVVPIGSLQCKHTSDVSRTLKPSDISSELAHVEVLVQLGHADTYVLMTNMSIDAPVALRLRRKLRELGVRKAHILGRQYIIRAIRSSPRLRALVPQVYGLGDLTAILDERLSRQSRALMDHWAPKLKTYVPTRAHRQAIRAQTEHGIVLLLGNPSSGKSAIGAILTTIASENPAHTVLALTSPRDFEAGWNPDDPSRFFWIDDAFGSNVLQEEYVQDWTSAFRKVQAAIAKGNRFLLTSRRHIYEGARKRLGARNLPVFADDRAVVDVGELTLEEKSQILYNHINFGEQTQSWKSNVKPHLATVAAVHEFLPGIAERLGDPAFTRSLIPRESALVRFMREPREHLIVTINALDDISQAALLLVYVHRGAFDFGAYDALAAQAVVDLSGVALPRILDRFPELKGSFLRGPAPGGERVWSFAHPTIADAQTEILREKPHMMPALLRGATIDTILTGFACEGAPAMRDVLTVPANQNDTLVERLLRTPDEAGRNWSLFSFLAWRTNDAVFGRVLSADPDILQRQTWISVAIDNDPKVSVHARAHRAKLLDDALREETAVRLERAALSRLDLSFFETEEKLALIPALRLVALGARLRAEALPMAEQSISELRDEADLDQDPGSHFEMVVEALNTIETIAPDETAVALIAAARRQIDAEVQHLTELKEERDNQKDDDDADWTQISTVSQKVETEEPVQARAGARSIFDDVDL